MAGAFLQKVPQVRAFFVTRGLDVRYTTRGEAYFQVATFSGPVPVRLYHEEEDDLLTFVAFAIDRVPLDRLDDAVALLGFLNFRAPGAAYLTLDRGDGEVSARAALPVASRIATVDAIAALVDGAVELVANALPVLPGVGFGAERAAPPFSTFAPGEVDDVN